MTGAARSLLACVLGRQSSAQFSGTTHAGFGRRLSAPAATALLRRDRACGLRKRLLSVLMALLGSLALGASPAVAQSVADMQARERASTYQAQVAVIQPQRRDGQAAPSGFGLLVGERDGVLYIAVPRHVVIDPDQLNDERPRVRLFGRAEWLAGRLGADSSPADDLAVVLFDLPSGYVPPRAPTVNRRTLRVGTAVWNIGCQQRWDMPVLPGVFSSYQPGQRKLVFERLPIVPGCSGGAVVAPDGIVGMAQVAGAGGGVNQLALDIDQLLEQFGWWNLPTNLVGGAISPPTPHAAPSTPVPVLRAPRSGVVFLECAECPEMVMLPAESFLMGSPASESDRDSDEDPERRVSVPSLAVGKFEVTFAQWDACVAAGGCYGYRPGDEGWGRSDRPVINVSWHDAQAYVQWLNERLGLRPGTYGLLTEAEWEYAARARTTTAFSTGVRIRPDQAQYTWAASHAGSPTRPASPTGTAPVGQFPANGFGLHDMHGNVWEWVQDCYRDSYQGAPTDGRAVGDREGCDSVLRGGSWNDNPKFLRSAFRNKSSPGDRNGNLGFRVARTF